MGVVYVGDRPVSMTAEHSRVIPPGCKVHSLHKIHSIAIGYQLPNNFSCIVETYSSNKVIVLLAFMKKIHNVYYAFIYPRLT